MTSELMRFYRTEERAATADNARRSTIVANLKHPWEASEKKVDEKKDTPKITKNVFGR